MWQKLKNIIQNFIRGDKGIWWIYGILSVMSVLIIYSTAAEDPQPLYSTLNHAKNLLIGFVLMFFCSAVPYQFWQRLAPIGYVAVIALVILAFFIGSSNGRQLFGVQPLEFGKVATIIFIAYFVHRQVKRSKNMKDSYWLLLFFIGLMVMPVMAASNSSAIIITAVSLIMLWLAGIRLWKILATMFASLCLLGLMVGANIAVEALAKQQPSSVVSNLHKVTQKFRLNTLQNRVKNWWTRIDDIYDKRPDLRVNQLEQEEMAIYAIASSGIFGIGPGNSVYKNLFVKGKNDLAFAVIVEEYGVLFSLLILFLYILLLFRIGVILRNTKDAFSSMVLMGFAILIATQALLHVFVSTGLFPNTGQNLPLISEGGSSIATVGIMLGIILNIAKSNEPKKKPAPAIEELKIES